MLKVSLNSHPIFNKMRQIKELLRPEFKITIFSWNQKYLIKFEQDSFEQTYKIDELELTSENDLDEILNETFFSEVAGIFKKMSDSFYKYTSQI